jgi:hypothetical protein
MTKTIIIAILSAFIFTNLPIGKQAKAEREKRLVNGNEKSLIKSIVLIRFEKSDILFNWDNSKSQIVEDALFRKIVYRFKSNEAYLADQITNLTQTPAIACGKDKLVIGDLAFLMINKIKHLPFFKITNVQCDSFETGCPYPNGYFDVIRKDRIRIKERVKHYLSINVKPI